MGGTDVVVIVDNELISSSYSLQTDSSSHPDQLDYYLSAQYPKHSIY